MKSNFKRIALVGLLGALLVACGPSVAPSSGDSLTTSYVDSVTVTKEEGKGKDGFDYFLKPGATATLTASYAPATATENLDITWSATPRSVLTITASEDGKTATITAKNEGDAVVTAKMYGEDNVDVISNAISFRVEGEHKTNEDYPLAKTTYMEGTKEKTLTIDTLYRNSGNPHMTSIGDAHVLVIPFGFQDYEHIQTKENLTRINDVFFNTTDEIKEKGGWESLSSFYQKSSYQKSQFTGRMPENWCVYNGTAEAFLRSASGNAGISAAEYGRKWYISEYEKEDHGLLGKDAEPLKWFDGDGDGFIDLIWVVYSHETIQDTDWWAYVTYTSNGSSKASPNVKTLGWASISWASEGLGGYDPHTFIHETGHTLGLDDYYDYNHKWSPMGGIDFMDHNVGDHCMYSKFQLGWVSPRVVTDDALITLRPGTTTGDCFIIPSPEYNNTVFDEYFMFELMAPVGLAEYDYKAGNGFSKPGIRVTHVDARVYKNDRDTFLKQDVHTGVNFRIDNSYGGRSGLYRDSDYFPILDKDGNEIKQNFMTQTSLMESAFTNDNNWTTVSTYNATNASLFVAGNEFNLNPNKGWAKTFMPSASNLWNKAKTITGWSKDKKTQTYTIDENCTFNYSVKVLSIDVSEEYGWTARVQVTPNAY